MTPDNILKIINEIRSIYEKNGTEFLYTPKELGILLNSNTISIDGKIRIFIKRTEVTEIVTPKGSYQYFLGSNFVGNELKAIEEIKERFGLIFECVVKYTDDNIRSYIITKE